MRLKFIATALAAIVATTSISMPASAQQKNQQQQAPAWLPLTTVATPFALGALIGSSTTTLVGVKTWTFPFVNTRNVFSLIGPNGGVTQGVHATSQYVHNVLNPKYFGETLTLDPKALHKPATGQHSTSAKYKTSGSSSSTAGKVMVGCIFGSALGAITSAMRKATAMGNPPRWRSQAEHEAIVRSGYEKQFELTNAEANMAIALCGLGSFALHWPKAAPVVTAKN